ncbi:MAG: efflux RND transporter periplasmic adaptor subunit [Methylibium sp.]|uniref:efflux RND transporter periplasmic adaptor subunit n=1 Tax=Methylibium sp. TaxID=2067992 RepID=UPI00183E5399|nr:efflux RND transporter periplasmic adaptor subunit [Methylibium sp.]MBA3598532.1 efflux RND transporter periplasmic adaptor subunit [Methylibium sp.]
MAVSVVWSATAAADEVPRQVVVAPVERAELVQQVEVRGSVTAPRTAQVSTSVAGLLSRIEVEEGDRIEAGQRIAQLDGELDSLDLRIARAATAEAEVQLAEARRRLKDAREIGAGFFPADETRSRESAVETAQALLARRQAEQARQGAVLARHELAAPFAGIVSVRHRQVGEWVEPGTPLIELVDLSGLRLEFALPQALYGRVGLRSALEVRLDTDPGRAYEGRVRAVIPVSDVQARTFTLRASLDNAPPLTPGMSARATLRLPLGREGVTVPRDALNRYPDGRVTVWVLHEEDGMSRVREQRIELGEVFGERVGAIEGLRGDEQVVVRGNEALRDGQRVAPQRAKAPRVKPQP